MEGDFIEIQLKFSEFNSLYNDGWWNIENTNIKHANNMLIL